MRPLRQGQGVAKETEVKGGVVEEEDYMLVITGDHATPVLSKVNREGMEFYIEEMYLFA